MLLRILIANNCDEGQNVSSLVTTCKGVFRPDRPLEITISYPLTQPMTLNTIKAIFNQRKER